MVEQRTKAEYEELIKIAGNQVEITLDSGDVICIINLGDHLLVRNMLRESIYMQIIPMMNSEIMLAPIKRSRPDETE